LVLPTTIKQNLLQANDGVTRRRIARSFEDHTSRKANCPSCSAAAGAAGSGAQPIQLKVFVKKRFFNTGFTQLANNLSLSNSDKYGMFVVFFKNSEQSIVY
jgi:hypothetical protein